MIQVQVDVDRDKMEQMYLDAINQKINEIDAERVLWDSQELQRQASMSWNTIKQNFFYDEEFPKAKIGGKWYFPSDEAKRFLKKWFAKKQYRG